MRYSRRPANFAASGKLASASTRIVGAGRNHRMKALLPSLLLLVAGLGHVRAEEALKQWELEVDGLKRTALVYAPGSANTVPAPAVFAFHGHGGSAQGAVRQFGINRHWPAAISVYMQGLNTPGRLTDPEGTKPGWQHSPGAQGDRDLKFFDAMLASLRRDYRVDDKRIYATGHSNGGGFTYLLWAMRGDQF